MLPGDPAWPAGAGYDWVCTAGLGCNEGWELFTRYEPIYDAPVEWARRCPCLVKNLRDKQRGKDSDGKKGRR